MKNKKYITLLFALLFTYVAQAQKPTLFIGATAHLGNGEVIQNSAISVNNGKFDLIADASLIRIDPSAFDTIIRIHGKHISWQKNVTISLDYLKTRTTRALSGESRECLNL